MSLRGAVALAASGLVWLGVVVVIATGAFAADSDPNSFNRLLKPAGERNPPPATDGIHDPTSAAVGILQAPAEAFAGLPRSAAGNFVDWSLALEDAVLQPRYDLQNPQAKPVVLDLNIVREVKGTMPDVVYPHKQHTQWLDCANCHPAIFIPQKGANVMSMAAIMQGQQCGVCHGKVAFPVSECRRCHSQVKPASAQPQATATSGK